MRKQFIVSVHRVYSVSTDNILMWLCKVLYTIQRRRFACYSWDMSLKVGLDASVGNI
jgi:hypothetical protein